MHELAKRPVHLLVFVVCLTAYRFAIFLTET